MTNPNSSGWNPRDRVIANRIKTELRNMPSTEAVAIASGSVFGLWGASSDSGVLGTDSLGLMCNKEILKRQCKQENYPPNREVQLQMAREHPFMFYTGSAVANGVNLGVLGALAVTGAYMGMKKLVGKIFESYNR